MVNPRVEPLHLHVDLPFNLVHFHFHLVLKYQSKVRTHALIHMNGLVVCVCVTSSFTVVAKLANHGLTY